MPIRIKFVICFVAMLLGACSSPPPTMGEAKDFPNGCDKVNDGKRVAVVGYLHFTASFDGNQSVMLRMYQGSDFAGNPIGVDTEFGSKANQVEPVKDQYADTDLKVYLADGKQAGLGTKVKVSGKVYYPLVGQEFACGLENPLVELAP